jgi:hypothetical protein
MPPPQVRAPTGYGDALRAAAVWAGFTLVMTLFLEGPPPTAASGIRAFGALLSAALAAGLLVWPLARASRPFWLLLLAALPAFLAVRLVLGVLTG